MKTTFFLRCSLLALFLMPATLFAQTPVRITADRVNLRAKAIPNAEVITQAAYDEQFTAFEIGTEWVEITAPERAELWVTKSLIQVPGNTVGANRVNVRAGPSINYNVVCTLERGETVTPRGEELGDWIKIAPPANARLWVSRDYIEIVSEKSKKSQKITENSQKTPKNDEISAKNDENVEKIEEKAEKATQKRKSEPSEGAATAGDIPTPIVTPSVPEKSESAREIPVPAPSDLKLIPLEGQGRWIEVTGELRSAPLINEAPSRYRVVRWIDNRWQIICHVYGEASKFRSLQGKQVHLKGRQYWIQGAAAPVLVPEQIQEITRPPP